MEETKGISLELLNRFVPYSFASIFRSDIHAYRSAAITRIEVKEVDTAKGCTLFFDDQTQLTIPIDVTGGGGDLIA